MTQTNVTFSELIGSPKQISWANDLRKAAAEKYADNLEFLMWLAGQTKAESIIDNKFLPMLGFERFKEEQEFLALSIEELEAKLEEVKNRASCGGMFAIRKKVEIKKISARIEELSAAG